MCLRGQFSEIELKFIGELEPILKQFDLKLYDLEFVSSSKTLQIFLLDPKTDTAQLEDCIKVDQALTPVFENSTWIPVDTALEVSSPGLFCELNQVWHFERVLGKKVSMVLFKSIDELFVGAELPKGIKGNKKLILTLKAVDSTGVTFEELGDSIKLDFSHIKNAKLETEF